jgi:2-amino-4-hydroxy-6-hydroxymethyldihydropteridine diphosphokinase
VACWRLPVNRTPRRPYRGATPANRAVLKTLCLGPGSNIGDREGHLRAAVERLAAADLRMVRESPVCETEPLELTAQRWFLNQVVEAETSLFPKQLLARVDRIERVLGRVRTVPNGPRNIDILSYASAVVRTAELEIPHPRMAARRFVLAPLADLCPELRHPVTRKTVKEVLEAAPGQAVRRV